MRVTILTSLYNGCEFIEGFMNDIVKQSAFDECLLYLLDCNHSDKYSKFLIDYSNRYNNIKYEKNRSHTGIGIYDAWNYMIENSNSDYITNANIDDRQFSNSLEKHIKFLDEYEYIDVAYSRNIVTHEPNLDEELLIKKYDSVKNALKLGKVGYFNCCDFSIENILRVNCIHNHPMWRRSLHNKYGLFSTKYKSSSDWEFWLRCAMFGSQMCLLDDILGIYYYNPNGISTASGNIQNNLSEIHEIRAIWSNKYI